MTTAAKRQLVMLICFLTLLFSKYDRPTEDRLANTSRTEDWFTESLYNKKVLELESLWRLARSYNHENPYILGEGKTIVLYES